MLIGKWDLVQTALDNYTVLKGDKPSYKVSSVRIEDTTNKKFYRFRRVFDANTGDELGIVFKRFLSDRQLKIENYLPDMVLAKLLELTDPEDEKEKEIV